jgi:group I intron endonuclease
MTNKEKLIDFILKLTSEEAERLLAHLNEISKPEPKPTPKFPYHRVIYSIKCNETGKEYIGRTEDLKKRMISHMSLLRCGKHPVEDLQSDFNKYGDSFTVSVLDEINDFKQNKREYELIESRGTYIRENGYNYNDTVFRRWKRAKDKAK